MKMLTSKCDSIGNQRLQIVRKQSFIFQSWNYRKREIVLGFRNLSFSNRRGMALDVDGAGESDFKFPIWPTNSKLPKSAAHPHKFAKEIKAYPKFRKTTRIELPDPIPTYITKENTEAINIVARYQVNGQKFEYSHYSARMHYKHVSEIQNRLQSSDPRLIIPLEYDPILAKNGSHDEQRYLAANLQKLPSQKVDQFGDFIVDFINDANTIQIDNGTLHKNEAARKNNPSLIKNNMTFFLNKTAKLIGIFRQNEKNPDILKFVAFRPTKKQEIEKIDNTNNLG